MPLQLFRSTDTNAPVLTGQAGKLTDLLDACLVNGYTTASVTGITRSGTTATATISANTTLRTGDWLTISGANETDYNVTAQITVLSSTQFTYAVSNSPTTPATGTILYKKAAAGWATAYTGTNKRAYRSPNGASNRFYVRVHDDTLVNVREAYARGYETMSDIDTGTGDFPTVAQRTNGQSWPKSITADATARPWTVIADDKTFYYIPQLNSNPANLSPHYGFGHFNSYKSADGFNTFLAGSIATNYTVGINGNYQIGSIGAPVTWGATSTPSTLVYVPRAYSQTGGAIAVNSCDGKTATSGVIPISAAGAGIVYPNGPDSGLWLAPLFIAETTGGVFNIRGRFPGIYANLHSTIPQSNYDFVTGVVGLSGVTLLAVSHSIGTGAAIYTPGLLHYDITGPW